MLCLDALIAKSILWGGRECQGRGSVGDAEGDVGVLGTHPAASRDPWEPTPQQAAILGNPPRHSVSTLPKREGGREGDRVFTYATRSVFKSLFQEDRTQQISSRSPSRFGRVAACCGVGSQRSQLVAGWVPKPLRHINSYIASRSSIPQYPVLNINLMKP